MSPPQDRRPPAQPDRRIIAGDEQPERGAVKHPGVDGADQDAPKKSTTLTGFPGVPLDARPLPAERAKTRRAPSPWGQTVLKPPPPSSVALARRSEPPATSEPPAPQTNASGRPDAPLPPPSLHPDEASAQASRRRAERAEQRADEEANERRRLELLLAIEQEKSKQAAAPSKPWLDERLTRALVAVLTALAALGAPMGIWLTAKASALEKAQERQAERAKDTTATASSAKAESRDAAKELDALKQQLAAERAYNREVLRRMGVQIPKRDGDPDPPTIETESPLRKPGTVTPGPVLVVKTAPP